jgi:DNA-binding response OmpR family regulator
MRVLVIEDELKVARALKQGLEEEHYDVVIAKTGEEGFFRASGEIRSDCPRPYASRT